MSRAYRDVSAERRAQAAACVERHLAELRATLTGDGLRYTVVEGSAVAAEVFLAETNTLHTAVRVAVRVTGDGLDPIDRALRRAGFDRAKPMGDGTLLRLAGRNGRRAIHVLFDGDGHGASGHDHPGSAAAARARLRLLNGAMVDVTTAYRRAVHDSSPEHDVTESFAVQVVAG
ncbi:MAG: hypothetical protein GY715_15680 [Planctomycetes bacterium]|nr:hypothetical protein [Planctomycetota bacterium]